MPDNSTHTLILKYRTGISLLFILMLTFLVYSPALFNGFLIWDDDQNIYLNPAITSLQFSNIKHFFTNYSIGMYQPLTSLSFALNYKITGLNPAGFHAGNLLLHLSNTLLVFVLVKSLSQKPVPALFAALFFGIHPMFVESVAWASERKDVLYGFFFLLTLIFYIRYLKKQNFLNYLIPFLLFLCAVLSKSTALLLPLILLLIDWYLHRKFTRKLWLEKIPFLIVSVIFAIIALKSQYNARFIDYSAYQYSIADRPFLGAWSLLFYFTMFFLPLKLSIIHPYPAKSGIFLPAEFYLALILLIILGFVIYLIIRKSGTQTRQIIIFGILFFIAMLLLCLHIVALPGFSVAAERYAYMPYLGLFFILSMLVSNNLEKFGMMNTSRKYFTYLLISVFAVFLSITTYSRNKDWKSNMSIFSDAIRKYPDAAMPYNNRGLAYSQSGKPQQAIHDFSRAIALKPDIATYHYNLGNAYLSVQNYPAAIKCYSNAIGINPAGGEASYINRGIAYQKSGLYIASYWDLTAAINCKGQFTSIAYFNRGMARLLLNDKKGACSDWMTSLKIGYTEAENQLIKHCR